MSNSFPKLGKPAPLFEADLVRFDPRKKQIFFDKISLNKIIDEKLAKMQQVVVLPKYQSIGVGKNLVNFSEKFISNIGINSILLHAREPVVGFYEKLGYEKFGEKFLEVTIPHHKMNKNLI